MFILLALIEKNIYFFDFSQREKYWSISYETAVMKEIIGCK